eukprot:3388017-Ditylum_brightwellii.AAC.1
MLNMAKSLPYLFVTYQAWPRHMNPANVTWKCNQRGEQQLCNMDLSRICKTMLFILYLALSKRSLSMWLGHVLMTSLIQPVL